MACEPSRLRRHIEPSSELDKLLQHIDEHEHHNAARFNGFELIRNGIGRIWCTMSLHESNESLHVSSPDRWASQCNEHEHRLAENESQAALVRIFEPLLDSIVIHLTGFTLQFGRFIKLPVCKRHRRECLRKRSARGLVTVANVLTQSPLE